jgi:hypothetical protein
MLWMFAGNALYYLTAVLLAFIYLLSIIDRRAFCKLVCPVPVVMKPPAAVALITVAPPGKPEAACVWNASWSAPGEFYPWEEFRGYQVDRGEIVLLPATEAPGGETGTEKKGWLSDVHHFFAGAVFLAQA